MRFGFVHGVSDDDVLVGVGVKQFSKGLPVCQDM